MRHNNPSHPGQPLIAMRQVVKTFQTPAGSFPALRGIDAGFHPGEFVSVVGKSGSGKSTLVNMITGIDRPTAGQIRVGDVELHDLSESEMSRWRGRNLGIVFQFYQLLPMLSLLENVMLPMDFCEVYDPNERETRAMALLDKVGLADDAHKMPHQVSGGQQQRAAVARALANDPPIIIADEPTGNLDSRAAKGIFRIFEELATQGKTILMVTHDVELAKLASRTLLLADGEVIDETVANVLHLMTHQQMLRATKSLQARRFAPGETIIRQGEINDHFYIVAQGEVEVILTREDGQEEAIASIGPGQFFGEVNLLHPVGPIAGVRAARHTPVEVLALGREIFTELMTEAGAMREEIGRVLRQRLAENAAHGGPARQLRDFSYA